MQIGTGRVGTGYTEVRLDGSCEGCLTMRERYEELENPGAYLSFTWPYLHGSCVLSDCPPGLWWLII